MIAPLDCMDSAIFSAKITMSPNWSYEPYFHFVTNRNGEEILSNFPNFNSLVLSMCWALMNFLLIFRKILPVL